MIRRRVALVLLLAGGVACKRGEQSSPQAAASDTGMNVVDSFKTPESVLYDAAGDVYFVSNINGDPLAKDNNGFISKVSPEGRVLQLRFAAGGAGGATLNAPKGLAIKGDTLFAADIDEVRMFSRTTGAWLGTRPVRGATFLNDMDVGPDGTVYVTDSGLKSGPNGFAPTGTDAVYRFDARGQSVAIIRGDSLGRPNGVAGDSAGVIVVTFGSGAAYRLDRSGRRTMLPKPPHGQLDGVVRLGGGALLISSWEDSSVVKLTPPDTTYTVVVHGVPSPADIGYDTRRGRLLIPSFLTNRIVVRPVR